MENSEKPNDLFHVLGDARLGDHAGRPPGSRDQVRKRCLSFSICAAERHRVSGVAVKHLDGDGTACRERRADRRTISERALLAVTAVATLLASGQAALPPGSSIRHVVQQHVARPWVRCRSGQRRLDRGLALQQPVECIVEFVLIDLAEAELFAEARCGGGGRQRTWPAASLDAGSRMRPTSRASTRSRLRSPPGPEDAVEADLARGAERGGDVAVRQAAGHGEGISARRDDRAALQHAAQALDVSDGPVGEVAQSALTDLAALAVALAQEDRRAASSGSERLRCTWPSMQHTGRGVQVLKYEITWLRFRRRRLSKSFQQLERESAGTIG